MLTEKSRCKLNSGKCTDWTKLRRFGYKSELKECIKLPYRSKRTSNGKDKVRHNKKSNKKTKQRNAAQ
ncbi:unnamed protein product [Adineta ricciae]|uniref:Uncharacterized protein n=1 Tax=Adineta ricciae TaxID=249248 RepID=A0A815EA34_ADIRI|nr:unnamed protein product [Adineta ricciae]